MLPLGPEATVQQLKHHLSIQSQSYVYVLYIPAAGAAPAPPAPPAAAAGAATAPPAGTEANFERPVEKR